MSEVTDTIHARASAPGRAGVTVFRVSGPGVQEIAAGLKLQTLKPRQAHLASIRNVDGSLIDRGLAILFPGPGSFTGQDVLELHLHGGRAVEIALYDALSALGSRLAEPGEFTLRAMKNGKLDLAQVEALADLIDAETNQQKQQALGQLDGQLAAEAADWRALLLKVLTPLAADIDFPDEEDVPAAIAANALPAIDALKQALQVALDSADQAMRIREGAQVVLLGEPNVGKSSLLNCLAGSDVAIVSDQPGTTRDVVEVRLDLGGMLVTIADTAGLRQGSADMIEQEGMRRTRARAETADLRILVLSVADTENVSRETIPAISTNDLIVWNKIDLAATPVARSGPKNTDHQTEWYISAKTGDGIAGLVSLIRERLSLGDNAEEPGLLTRQRHVEAVSEALAALDRARENVMAYPELAAEDLRLADRAFRRLVGAVDVEDVLGEIFSSFCIGK